MFRKFIGFLIKLKIRIQKYRLDRALQLNNISTEEWRLETAHLNMEEEKYA